MILTDDPIQSAIRLIYFLRSLVQCDEPLNEADERDIKTIVSKLRELQQKRGGAQ